MTSTSTTIRSAARTASGRAGQSALFASQAPQHGAGDDVVGRLFDHWLYMHGKSAARCKLGPLRRQAALAALAMGYDEDVLMQAIEGNLVCDWCQPVRTRSGTGLHDFAWIFAEESRIEQFADMGLALRDRAEQAAERALQRAQGEAPPSPEEAAQQLAASMAAREHLRRVADGMRLGNGRSRG